MVVWLREIAILRMEASVVASLLIKHPGEGSNSNHSGSKTGSKTGAEKSGSRHYLEFSSSKVKDEGRTTEMEA